MMDDPRVYALVRAAAPPKYRILDVLERCSITGRKHTYTVVLGGPGCQKENIGLALIICPNARPSQCNRHLKPLPLQMSVEKRLGLLLDLAVLDPPPFKSEEFARWCCQTTVSLLARDALAVDANPPLPPGVFLAFTPYIPGHEDLPRLGRDMDHPSLQVVGRAHPVVTTAEGEEVDVLVVIYEMDRHGPFRVVAKGKKLGALVGFTFRQPAILQALGLAPNSRELSAYLMYEPFQQAWTKPVQPSQTLTLCEGGGVIYRHRRVNIVLWLDRYIKDVYPNWVRCGTVLRNLAAAAAEQDGAPALPSHGAPLAKNAIANATTKRALLALPAPPPPAIGPAPGKNAIAKATTKRALLALPAPPSPVAGPAPMKNPIPKVTTRALLALPAPAPPVASRAPTKNAILKVVTKRALRTLPAAGPPIVKLPRATPTSSQKSASARVSGQNARVRAGVAKERAQAGSSATLPIVIDLTDDANATGHRKRKRYLQPADVTVDLKEIERERKRTRRMGPRMKIEGRGTEGDPYVL